MVGTLYIATIVTSTATDGTFDMQMETRFKLSVRKGDVRNNPRGGGTITKLTKIGDVFGVAKARALSGFRKSMPTFQLLTEDVCFK